jgi:hypothetical protein
MAESPTPPQPRGAIVERARVEPCGRRGAQIGPSLEAVPAATAGRRERQHHALANPGLSDARADALDDAGPLVTKDDRDGNRPLPVDVGKIAAADTGGVQPDEHLVRPRVVELQLIDLERAAGGGEHGALDAHQLGSGGGAVEPRTTSSGGESTTMSRGRPP